MMKPRNASSETSRRDCLEMGLRGGGAAGAGASACCGRCRRYVPAMVVQPSCETPGQNGVRQHCIAPAMQTIPELAAGCTRILLNQQTPLTLSAAKQRSLSKGYLLNSPKSPPFLRPAASRLACSSSLIPRRRVRSAMLRVRRALGANRDRGTPLFREPTMVA